jgi:hypothetical protein
MGQLNKMAEKALVCKTKWKEGDYFNFLLSLLTLIDAAGGVFDFRNFEEV